jgi:hypothetical protein
MMGRMVMVIENHPLGREGIFRVPLPFTGTRQDLLKLEPEILGSERTLDQ